MQIKTKKYLSITLKLIILIVAIFFVAFHLKNAQDKHEFFHSIPMLWRQNYYYLLLILILIPVNWGIESLKWKYILRKYCPINYINAFKSVVAGVSTGIITPNRIGEFGGRILYLPKTYRKKGTVLSLISSYAQYFTTLLIGIPALVIFISTKESQISVGENYLMVLLLVTLSGLIMLLFFRLDIIEKILLKLPFIKKHEESVHQLSQLPRKDLYNLLMLSILRYTVFIIQFFFMCQFFSLEIHFIEVLIAGASLYFLMSLLPMFTLGEPGLRAGLTAILFGQFTLNITGVISASVLLWIFNVLLVSLTGAIILFTKKNIII
jgi:uncharacterized membrane protein YbhN (UPF0104 family)